MTKNEAKPAIASVSEHFRRALNGLREIVRAVMQEMLEAERFAAVRRASARKHARKAAR